MRKRLELRVLQVTTHLNIGGISKYIVSLSGALKEKGVDTVVASSGGNMEKELRERGIPHKTLDMDTKFEFGPKVFKSAFMLTKIIRKEKVDVIHAHSRVSQVASSLASMMSGSPLVTTCHGYFKKRLRGIFDTWGKKVIAISDAVRTHLEEDLGVKDNRIAVIYNGVDIDRFSKKYSHDETLAIKKSIGLKDAPAIGTIGRLSPVKGQIFFIQAMAKVAMKRPDAQAIIVGDGGEEDSLKKMVRSLDLEESIRFIKSDPDTHKYLSVMDVFVFPSVKEGLGLALLEAMAQGLPCVASNIGGISNVIEDGSTGILVPVGDAQAIADSITILLGDAGLRARLGERARALVGERFSIDSMTGKIVKLYEEVSKG
ncbi:MAG: glycosyltransferase family 4 protein [Candidatus Omnitrophica bacterium]|nr:glycosyltransferase family 4 protein [Candidatus Omnitrophota bacterium]